MGRSLVLVAIGAMLASAIFWLASRHGVAPRQELIVHTDRANGLALRRQPDLPPPRKGPGGLRLGGVVVDGAGAAVGGVHVTALLEPGEGKGKTIAAVVAVADARGAFALEGLVPGRYQLRVEGPDVFTGELRFVPVPSDEARVVVARRVKIVGTVMDGGAVVRGADVHLVGDAVTGTLTATSANDGAFEFPDLPEGSYQVWAESGDDLVSRAQRALRLGAGPFPPIKLTLESAAIVIGRVEGAGGGAPIVAEVALRPAELVASGGVADEPPRFARTDRDGAFRVTGVPHGRWTAEAYAPGWISTGGIAFEAGKAPLVLELEPGAMIEGTITDGAGRPIEGAEVSAAAGDALVSAVTEDDRLRELAGLGHAAAIASSSAPGAPGAFGADARFVPRGELGVLLGPIPLVSAAGGPSARRADLVDAPGATTASIAGATPAPLPADPDHAPIWITGADGRYRIPGLAGGTWTVIARAPDYAEGRSRPATLAIGQTIAIDLALSRGVFVVGAVHDDRGEIVIGALIELAREGAREGETITAFTDEAGEFRAGPIAGTVHVRASAYGHADAERTLDLPAPRDAAHDERVELVLASADAAIEGELDDPSGLPVADAELEIVGRGAARRATTDASGRFRIGNLAPGPLRLRARAPGFPPQELTSATDPDVRLQLALGGGVDGLVFDHHTGQPIAGAAITASGPGGQKQDAETGADGRFTIAPIVAGAWRLKIALGGYLPVARDVDVPAGDRAGAITARDLRVELERGATLGGLVRDGYGSRLPGALVTVRRRGATADDDVTATARTDADGAFRVDDTPTGELEVTVDKDNLHGATTLTMRPGDELLSLQLEAQ